MGMLPDIREMIAERKNLGILADDNIREAFVDACKFQNDYKDKVDRAVASNAQLRHAKG